MKNKIDITLAVYSAALAKIQNCRSVLPGSEGDEICSRLRSFIHARVVTDSLTRDAIAALYVLGARSFISTSVEIAALKATLEPEPEQTFSPNIIYKEKPPVNLSALEERIARIEKRENSLAELFRQISVLELQLRHAADKARAKQAVARIHRRIVVSAGKAAYTPIPFLKDDPEYARLQREIRGLYDSVRRIRETTLPTV